MDLKLKYEKGQTPIDEDEKQGLKIKSLRRGDDRTAYIKALRKADNDDIEPLIKFSEK